MRLLVAVEETLLIKPKLDTKDLNNLERQLQTRFKKIAKKFGSGIAGSLKGGGLLGIGLGLVNKLLNPLQEVKDAIDRSITSADDMATNAGQFGTTTGNLYKLSKLGQAAGLEQDTLFTLLSKFQTAVASAKLNPNDPTASAVKNFTGEKDTVDGFFKFIQALQKANPEDAVLAQEQIFGAKSILKTADFLQQDFPSLIKKLGLNNISSETISKQQNYLAGASDYKDILATRTSIVDDQNKAASITYEMIRSQDKAARLALASEDLKIKSYHDLAELDKTTKAMMVEAEKFVLSFSGWLTSFNKKMDALTSSLADIATSPTMRGIMKFLGGK